MVDLRKPSVSLGFPVYNEEKTVEGVLREAEHLMAKSGLDYEIIVCNDGSTDTSLDIIKRVDGQFSNIRVINHPRNLGIRETFEDLYKEARKDFVFVNATDRQWDTAILLDMLPLVKDGDIIIASRKNKPYTPLRRFISWFFNMVPILLFGVRTFDAGAVKLMKREIVGRFTLVSRSPFSEAERLIRAAKAGYRIVEYPVSVSPRTSGQSHAIKINTLFSALADVLRIWVSMRFGKRKEYSDIRQK